jgi:hypothetical protein
VAGGGEGVDVVANEPTVARRTVWLIEAKDYRVITKPPRKANLGDLPQTVDAKVRATIGALPAMAAATTNALARAHASAASAVAARPQVVLHLEPHPANGQHSALFPSGYPALVLQKLRQLLRDVDATPRVLDIARTPAAGVPWVVA